MRNFKHLDVSTDYEEGRTFGFALLEETLSDGSKSYSVRGYDWCNDEFILDFPDYNNARKVFNVLCTCVV